MALYIGLMSGTSVDAIDAALVEFPDLHPDLDKNDNGDPEEAACRIARTHTHPYPTGLRERIDDVIDGTEADPVAVWILDRDVGEAFAEAAIALLAGAGLTGERVTAIGSHGQTVFHAPHERVTVQIGDPNIVAQRTAITTVGDLRRRDVAAGGQGAPLAPAFHAWIFRRGDAARAVLNLGGIANLSVLPPRGAAEDVLGFDTGPANTLLDQWCRQHLQQPFDKDAHWSSGGEVLDALLAAMRSDPYFTAPPPKSTGRELFNLDWLARFTSSHAIGLAPRDVARTLVELTATTVADALERHGPDCADVLVCGGGAENPLMMKRLGTLLSPRAVVSTATAGIDPQWVEAAAFAWMARQTLNGLPCNAPSVTGASGPVSLGGIYPA